MKKYLITGCAGFIGTHLAMKLLDEGYHVLGIDNLNNYYDINLKKDRLGLLLGRDNFLLNKIDLCEKDSLINLIKNFSPDCMINLAAQAGVRYSLENPDSYINSNLIGFHNFLEAAKEIRPKLVIYASSSSVYGGNEKIPFEESDNTSNTISLYAATKKANEVLANSFSINNKIQTVGLRFFTVYGPWGRPDMAYFSFVNSLLANKEITIFNDGQMSRDMTFVDDIINGIFLVIQKRKDLDLCEIFNLGNSSPIPLGQLIQFIEESFGREFAKKYIPLSGEVLTTFADLNYSRKKIGFIPSTPFEVGMNKFLNWYKIYYGYED